MLNVPSLGLSAILGFRVFQVVHSKLRVCAIYFHPTPQIQTGNPKMDINCRDVRGYLVGIGDPVVFPVISRSNPKRVPTKQAKRTCAGAAGRSFPCKGTPVQVLCLFSWGDPLQTEAHLCVAGRRLSGLLARCFWLQTPRPAPLQRH